jgi:UDP-N-acetylmuramoyl-tripeptide--D-alanyl-D-alanine ligase
MSFARILLEGVIGVVAAVGFGAQLLRWLRVLQREHYEPGALWRFYARWAAPEVRSARANPRWADRRPVPWTLLALAAAMGLILTHEDLAAVGLLALHGIWFPPGLSVRGRTGALAWTRRLRTLAALAVALVALALAGALAAARPWAVVAAVLVFEPALIEIAALVTRPLEDHLAGRYVAEARARLERVAPRVVAITGSFGKTSTKHHLAELLGARHGVVPSPRSFNNRAGLSRAINENLTDGTWVFIAEMGTYGPGEIAALCRWCVPEIAIVTAIGPVHLERMRSIETIEAAKFEITERAATVVLNADDDRLVAWLPRLAAAGKRVRTGGSAREADVRVVSVSERWRITVDGEVVAIAPLVVGVREVNLACAIAAALELGCGVEEVVSRLAHLTPVSNRMVVATAPSGVMVIDDTFNANPAGAHSALGTLATLPINGRRVVVTPGMVELGHAQEGANAQLGESARAIGAELVVVGRTNATALLAGYRERARRFDTREQAVEWVRGSLRAGDGVLYLNDLPDHYP